MQQLIMNILCVVNVFCSTGIAPAAVRSYLFSIVRSEFLIIAWHYSSLNLIISF